MNNEELIKLLRETRDYHYKMIFDFDTNCESCPIVKKGGKDIDCRSLLKMLDDIEDKELSDEY